MKQKNKKNIYKYDLGSFVKSDTDALGAPIGAVTNMLGSTIGGAGGSILSSAGSLAAAGASLGPLGIAGGALIGGTLGLIGANKQKKAATNARNDAYTRSNKAYVDQFNSNLDTDNQNAYGNLSYKDGGPIKGKKSVYPAVPNDLDWIHQDIKTPKGNLITDKDYRAYKSKGLDFGNTKELGNYIDSFASPMVAKNPTTIKTGREGMSYESTGLHNRQIGNMYADGGIIGDPMKITSKQESTKVVTPNISKANVNKKLLDKYEKSVGTEYRNGVEKLLNKYGNPTISEESGWFGGVASYNPLTNNIRSGTENIKNNDLYSEKFTDNIIKELAHSKQRQDKGLLGMAGQWLSKDAPSYASHTYNKITKGSNSKEAFLSNPYIKRGTLENDAHNSIEPNLNKELNGILYNKHNSVLDKIKTQQSMGKYAEGGEVIPSIINIEKGELQIDPKSGKVLREYTGMNPETGGLYEPHSKKGRDTNNNMVSAEEGSFIITKAKAKDYKKAIDENDKIRQDTILQNIANYKKRQDTSEKMADGGYLFAPGEQREGSNLYNPRIAPTITSSRMNTNIAGLQTGYAPSAKGSNIMSKLGQGADFLTQYSPSLMNIGKGLFGNVDKTNEISPTINPYKSQILNNMSQDIDFDPVRQQVLRQQNTAFNQIDNTTSSNPIARANKTNIYANTQNTLGKLAMDNQINNNQVRGQRAGIYSNLGNQEMNELNRVQNINLGIQEQNRANQAAKDNLLSEGIGQLQQTYQNNKTNKRKAELDQYQVDLLKQIFPSINPYFDTTFNPNKKRG